MSTQAYTDAEAYINLTPTPPLLLTHCEYQMFTVKNALAPPPCNRASFGVQSPTMPYSPAQHRLFAAAAHNPRIAAQHAMSQTEARKMMNEGVKPDAKRKALAKALRAKR